MVLTKTLTESQTAVVNKIASLNLGWETGMTSDYVTEETINQMIVNAPSIGSGATNTETGDLQYNYPLRLAPGITRTKQRIDVRSGGFDYNSVFGTFPSIYPINSYNIYRTISAHATCPFVHQEYEVGVYLLANVEVDAEIYESALADPFFMRGDWLWNPLITSWDPTIVVEPTLLDNWLSWWEEYGWIIILVLILGVGIYLFIQIGVPLIAKNKTIEIVRKRY